jgi:hypothetical protein
MMVLYEISILGAHVFGRKKAPERIQRLRNSNINIDIQAI